MKVENKEVVKDVKENTEKITPKEDLQKTPLMRQILIETDGNAVKLTRADVAGKLELVAILQSIINFINQPKQG